MGISCPSKIDMDMGEGEKKEWMREKDTSRNILYVKYGKKLTGINQREGRIRREGGRLHLFGREGYVEWEGQGGLKLSRFNEEGHFFNCRW